MPGAAEGSDDVATSKWLVIARNEYRVNTGRVRRFRPYLPFVVIILLAVHVILIAPAVVSLFVDDAISLLLSQAAVASVQVTLFITFFYFLIMPILGTLREAESGQLEILLCSPIRPSDLLLGDYLGELPFYGIIITVLAGIFAAIMGPLGMGLAQTGIVILIFVLTSVSAFWIGIVVSSLLRTKLERYAGGKDIGKAIAMVMPLPLIAILYAAFGGGLLQALSDPESSGIIGSILRVLPSSWGASVVVDFASNPGDLGAMALKVFSRVGALVSFFIVSLWIGARVADRGYSLERASISSSVAKPDGTFYHSIRSMGGGGSFGVLLLSLIKDYARRLENISNIVYMLGILGLMNIFLISESGDGPPGSLMVALFLYPILVVMVTGDITVAGKENLFIHRKAPSGVVKYLKAMLVRGWLLMVPIVGSATLVITLLQAGMTIPVSLVATALIVLIICANVTLVLGLFLVNPAYSEKSPRIWLNVMTVMIVQIGLFVVAITIMTKGGSAEPIGGFIGILFALTGLSWGAGVGLLSLGKKQLDRIE